MYGMCDVCTAICTDAQVAPRPTPYGINLHDRFGMKSSLIFDWLKIVVKCISGLLVHPLL